MSRLALLLSLFLLLAALALSDEVAPSAGSPSAAATAASPSPAAATDSNSAVPTWVNDQAQKAVAWVPPSSPNAAAEQWQELKSPSESAADEPQQPFSPAAADDSSAAPATMSTPAETPSDAEATKVASLPQTPPSGEPVEPKVHAARRHPITRALWFLILVTVLPCLCVCGLIMGACYCLESGVGTLGEGLMGSKY